MRAGFYRFAQLPLLALSLVSALAMPLTTASAQTQYVWTDLRPFSALEVTPEHKAALQAADAAPDSLPIVLAAVRADLDALRFREVLTRYDLAIRRWPDNADLHFAKGRAEFALRRFDRALRSLDRTLTIDDNRFDAWMLLGAIWFASGAHPDAVRAFDRARLLAPDSAAHAEATYWLWPALTRAGAFDPARRIVARDYAATLASDHARAIPLYRGTVSPGDAVPPLMRDTRLRLLRQHASAQHEFAAGDTAAAQEMFGRMLVSAHWATPEFVVAEREHARLTALSMRRSTAYLPAPASDDEVGSPRLSCLATVAANQSRRVMIRAALRTRWPDGADSVADLAMQRMAEHLDRAVTSIQAGMDSTALNVPTAEPKFTWLGLTGGIDAQLSPDGRVQWRLVGIDDAHIARSGRAITALAAAMFSPAEALDSARAWPRVAGDTPIRFRIEFVAPIVFPNDITLDTASNAVLIPAFSMRLPIVRGAEIDGGVNIDVPRNTTTALYSGNVLMQFNLDTLGRVVGSTLEEIWDSPDPRPSGEALVHYDAYLGAVRRWLLRSRWTPGSLGGCRATQVMRFRYNLWFML
jgi:tetratricopeptide (TPR) repeat protein